jgi:hypothetical protein
MKLISKRSDKRLCYEMSREEYLEINDLYEKKLPCKFQFIMTLYLYSIVDLQVVSVSEDTYTVSFLLKVYDEDGRH